MEDKEVKKKLKKVPDVDSTGEPIWKIEANAQKSGRKKSVSGPASQKQHRGGARGNR